MQNIVMREHCIEVRQNRKRTQFECFKYRVKRTMEIRGIGFQGCPPKRMSRAKVKKKNMNQIEILVHGQFCRQGLENG